MIYISVISLVYLVVGMVALLTSHNDLIVPAQMAYVGFLSLPLLMSKVGRWADLHKKR